MIKAAFMILIGILSTGSFGVSLHMLLMSHFSPRWLLKVLDGPNDSFSPAGPTKAGLAYMVCAMIGFGLMAFAGTVIALWWIPDSIGLHDDSGDFTGLRYVIAGPVALWVGVHLPSLIHRATSASK